MPMVKVSHKTIPKQFVGTVYLLIRGLLVRSII